MEKDETATLKSIDQLEFWNESKTKLFDPSLFEICNNMFELSKLFQIHCPETLWIEKYIKFWIENQQITNLRIWSLKFPLSNLITQIRSITIFENIICHVPSTILKTKRTLTFRSTSPRLSYFSNSKTIDFQNWSSTNHVIHKYLHNKLLVLPLQNIYSQCNISQLFQFHPCTINFETKSFKLISNVIRLPH